ncbi:MAG: cation diffusion facilitator family transporter [Promethearchaeota archaeon]
MSDQSIEESKKNDSVVDNEKNFSPGGETKTRVANLIIIYSISVLCIKILTVIISKSLSVVSEMIDSAIDIVLVFIMKRSIEKSKERPDSEHTFGKGRFETVGAIIQSIIIVVVYALIIDHAIENIFSPQGDVEGASGLISIFVMVGLLFSNFLLGTHLMKKAKKLVNDTLKIQAYSYLFDAIRSVIVIAAISLVIAGFKLADPIFAIVISIIIVIATFLATKDIFGNLLEKNPLTMEEQIAIIENTVLIDDITGIQDMRAKRVGDNIFLVMTILMDEDFKLKYCHQKTDEAERKIRELYPDKNLEIIFHVHGF